MNTRPISGREMWYRPYTVRMRSTCVSYVYLVRMCNDLYIISVPRVLIHSVNLHWRSHELTHAHAATVYYWRAGPSHPKSFERQMFSLYIYIYIYLFTALDDTIP